MTPTFRQLVGQRIRRERERRGMTQNELAHALGVANTQVSRWETGAAFPERYIEQLRDILGVSAEDVVEDMLPGEPNGNGNGNGLPAESG